jgi:hypothetical protein
MRWSGTTAVLIAALAAIALWIGAGVGVDTPKAPSLQYQWLATMLTLVALCGVAGIFVNGRPDGVLIDDRHRLSLSRLQWVAWFVVLLSAYFVGTLLNVKSGYANPFPTMQNELFALIGLASGSAVVSKMIVSQKKIDPTVPSVPAIAPVAAVAAVPGDAGIPGAAGVPGNVGKIDVNASSKEASWKDFYCGEEVVNRDVVDVSRLQQLVTTLLLVFVYIGFLWRDLDTAAFSGNLAAMPQVNANFIELLGISHAGYLAYKATPKN